MSNVTKNTAELESAFLVSPPKQVGGYRIGNQPTGYVQFNSRVNQSGFVGNL
jgi:hypothetical protein